MEEVKKKEKNYFKEFVPYLIIILFVVFLKAYVISPIRVNGVSMNPTLDDRDIMLLDEVSYYFIDIHRFDIVVIRQDDEYLIKRVIGLPGEEIHYEDDKLFIDGEYVEEDYDRKETSDFSTKLGENEYFVMGDNRTNSTDSRIFGPVSKEEIVGKTSFTILPFSRFGTKE